jgi:hypothetical protein
MLIRNRVAPGARLELRSRIVLLATAAALVIGIAVSSLLVAGASASPSRTLATCTPTAWVPHPSNHFASATGYIQCDSGAPTWQFTLRLVTRSGAILTEKAGGPGQGSQAPSTGAVGCAGHYVHSYLYINVGGAGKSSTSGEDGSLC